MKSVVYYEDVAKKQKKKKFIYTKRDIFCKDDGVMLFCA